MANRGAGFFWTHLFNCFCLNQGELLVLIRNIEGEFDVWIAVGTETKSRILNSLNNMRQNQKWPKCIQCNTLLL